jgi:hypothetical protein
LVKLALGDLVIVGDLIEYLQRVQMRNSPAPGGGPALTVNTAQVVFGNQTNGAASKAVDVTLTNAGTTSVSGIVVGISGTNQNEFSISKTTCTATLAAATPCTISVVFTLEPRGRVQLR